MEFVEAVILPTDPPPPETVSALRREMEKYLCVEVPDLMVLAAVHAIHVVGTVDVVVVE